MASRIDWHAKADAFVEFWQAAASADDVARHFNTGKQTVCSFASFLRKNGVKLKNFTTIRGRSEEGWKHLRLIAEQALSTQTALAQPLH